MAVMSAAQKAALKKAQLASALARRKRRDVYGITNVSHLTAERKRLHAARKDGTNTPDDDKRLSEVQKRLKNFGQKPKISLKRTESERNARLGVAESTSPKERRLQRAKNRTESDREKFRKTGDEKYLHRSWATEAKANRSRMPKSERNYKSNDAVFESSAAAARHSRYKAAIQQGSATNAKDAQYRKITAERVAKMSDSEVKRRHDDLFADRARLSDSDKIDLEILQNELSKRSAQGSAANAAKADIDRVSERLGVKRDFAKIMEEASRSETTSNDEALVQLISEMNPNGRSSYEKSIIKEAKEYYSREQANAISEELGRKFKEHSKKK